MPLQPTQVLLNKYRIERLIGEGGFGYVYEATDLNLNRRVAIKELKTELASNQEMLGRFVSEARAVANLNDPHIVQVLDYHKEEDHHYIVLEYMDSGSLAGLLSKRGSLTPGEAAMIAKAISDGLAVVHRQGIVHRDLKPSNILLARNGQIVKISDFGIAHVPQSVSGIGNLTRVGTAMGTVWYMSPEQARGERVDGRSDIYSLGTMLYEMVAGYMYLNFSSDFLRDLDTLKTTPPRPLPPAVPEGLQRIISKAIAVDPAQRYQTAEAMSADLQAFVTPGGTIAVPRTDPGRQRVPPPVQPRVRSPMPLIAVGVLVGIVVLGLLAFAAYKMIADQPTSRAAVPQLTALVVAPQSTTAPIADLTAVWQGVAATATANARATQAMETATRAPIADLTAVWQGVAATATANARATQAMETAIAARVVATLTAAAPTSTPSPTGTRPVPTVTLTPVPTIPPPTRIAPGLYVTSMRMEPFPPRRNQSVGFYATFLNTAEGIQDFRWLVYIYRADSFSKSIGETSVLRSLVSPGTAEIKSLGDWKTGIGGCENYVARAAWLDENRRATYFLNPEGQIVEFAFTVCP